MRAHNVTLSEVIQAIKFSNADVGARTIEINKAEYVIRGMKIDLDLCLSRRLDQSFFFFS